MVEKTRTQKLRKIIYKRVRNKDSCYLNITPQCGAVHYWKLHLVFLSRLLWTRAKQINCEARPILLPSCRRYIWAFTHTT